MPGYKMHLAGGLVTSGLLLTTGTAMQGMSGQFIHHLVNFVPSLDYPLVNAAGIVLFGLFGALFPDTDTDSKGQNLIYSIFILIDIGLLYQKSYKMAAYLGLFAMLPALGHHRGWTHSWLAMLLVGAPIVIIPTIVLGSNQVDGIVPFYLSFTLGYLSHLVLDALL
nr:metal-dependent hydrolase [uncultured Desulfobulbus sp.]